MRKNAVAALSLGLVAIAARAEESARLDHVLLRRTRRNDQQCPHSVTFPTMYSFQARHLRSHLYVATINPYSM